MDLQVVNNLISSVGFPIFVAVWMLYKSSKDSSEMKDTINELKNAITEMTTLLRADRNDKEDKENG